MQTRRRQQKPSARTPAGAEVTVPGIYWDELNKMRPEEVIERTLTEIHPTSGYQVPFLNRLVQVDTTDKCLRMRVGFQWKQIDDPLLELIMLLYLKNASFAPLRNEMVTTNELKERHFFVGIHSLDLQGVANRYGEDPKGFCQAAEAIGGKAENFADISYSFHPLPKIPITYLLWLGDEEFKPRFTVCFDRSIEKHFAADGIWAIVKRLSFELLTGSNFDLSLLPG